MKLPYYYTILKLHFSEQDYFGNYWAEEGGFLTYSEAKADIDLIRDGSRIRLVKSFDRAIAAGVVREAIAYLNECSRRALPTPRRVDLSRGVILTP